MPPNPYPFLFGVFGAEDPSLESSLKRRGLFAYEIERKKIKTSVVFRVYKEIFNYEVLNFNVKSYHWTYNIFGTVVDVVGIAVGTILCFLGIWFIQI